MKTVTAAALKTVIKAEAAKKPADQVAIRFVDCQDELGQLIPLMAFPDKWAQVAALMSREC